MAGKWMSTLQTAWRSNVPFGRALPEAPVLDTRPDWEQADPRWIRAALQRSQQLPSGGAMVSMVPSPSIAVR